MGAGLLPDLFGLPGPSNTTRQTIFVPLLLQANSNGQGVTRKGKIERFLARDAVLTTPETAITPLANYAHRLATDYRDAGLSVIPLRLNGTKAPAITSWQPYRERIANDGELAEWFCQPAGIGLLMGRVSGGAETIDFDMAETFWPWSSMISSETFAKLAIVETGGGGWHAIYRCQEFCGSRKLAMWEAPSPYGNRELAANIGKGVRIETRGEAATGSALQSKWGKFNALVALDFGGDRKAAVKHVRQLMIGISNGH